MHIRNLVVVLAAACMMLATSACQAAERPNVIVIVADDLGYADLSFLPQAPADVKRLGTPALDRLAKMGTYFDNAYATAPICSPARVGLLTGRYQQRWGNYWYGEGGLPRDEATLPQLLKPLGYVSKKIGKTHLNGGPVHNPIDHGFDEYLGFQHHTWDYIRLSHKDLDAYKKRAAGKGLGILCVGPLERGKDGKASYENGFTTEIFTDEAVEFITRDHGGKPFYIQLEYNAVHMPTYITHPKYAKRVGFVQPEWDRNAAEWEFPYWDPRKSGWHEWHQNWGHMKRVDPLGRKRYLSHLIAMDDGIGKIVKTLEDSGQLDNTVIVFVSDNGGTINTYSDNTPLNGWKYMFGEGGIRIPMIVVQPGKRTGGRVRHALASTMDIAPTVLELVGAETPGNFDGRSLLPAIANADEKGHAFICWSNGRKTKVIRKGDWKLAIDAGWKHVNFKLVDGMAERDPNEYVYPDGKVLFNLRDDIGETRNLAEARPEVVAELKAEYDAWRAEMSDPRDNKGNLKKKKK